MTSKKTKRPGRQPGHAKKDTTSSAETHPILPQNANHASGTDLTNTRLPQIAKAIKALEKNDIQNAIKKGKLLEEAYEQCDHGEFMVWLRTEFGWSYGTASNLRNVYALSQNHKICDFEKLDISISALYLAARCLKDEDPDHQAAGIAILEAAKQARVSYKMAIEIEANAAQASPVEAAPAIEAVVDAEPVETEPVDAEPVEAEPPPVNRQPPLLSLVRDVPVKNVPDPMVLLLEDVVRKSASCDWAKVIGDVGPEVIRGIISDLQLHLDQYDKQQQDETDTSKWVN